MTVAIATLSDFPGQTANRWKSPAALTALLLTALVVMALAGRGEAAGCGGATLTLAEVSLPEPTNPV